MYSARWLVLLILLTYSVLTLKKKGKVLLFYGKSHKMTEKYIIAVFVLVWEAREE